TSPCSAARPASCSARRIMRSSVAGSLIARSIPGTRSFPEQELSPQDGVYVLACRSSGPASSREDSPGTMRKLIATTILVLIATAAFAAAADASEGQSAVPYVPGQLLVRFDGGGERVLKLPQGVELPAAERALDSNPAVDYAVPNYLAHASSVPNDPGTAGVLGGWERMQWNFLPCGSLCGESAT